MFNVNVVWVGQIFLAGYSRFIEDEDDMSGFLMLGPIFLMVVINYWC